MRDFGPNVPPYALNLPESNPQQSDLVPLVCNGSTGCSACKTPTAASAFTCWAFPTRYRIRVRFRLPAPPALLPKLTRCWAARSRPRRPPTSFTAPACRGSGSPTTRPRPGPACRWWAEWMGAVGTPIPTGAPPMTTIASALTPRWSCSRRRARRLLIPTSPTSSLARTAARP